MVFDFYNQRQAMNNESCEILAEIAGKANLGTVSGFITIYQENDQLKCAVGGAVDTDRYISWLERLKFELLVGGE